MGEILSLWRSPLDIVAEAEAVALRDRQPRGSIGFGTDFSAMTVYNFGAFSPSMTGNRMANSSALGNMFSAMSAADPVGGMALVEQLAFPVNAPADGNGFAVPDQCNIIGIGGGGHNAASFYHFEIHGTGSLKFLNCSGNYTSGGKYFYGLAFAWNSSMSDGDTCIYADTENCRAVRCTFTNCPTAFNAQGTCCFLEQCTTVYTAGGYAGATFVIIAGSQCGVLGPGEVGQVGQYSGGPPGCTGISIEGPAEHTVITKTHVYQTVIGIDFAAAAGSRNTQITDCEIQCIQSAIRIQLPADAGTEATTGVKISGCTLTRAADSSTFDDHPDPVVLIDPQLAYNSNSQLRDITLVDCTVFNTDPTPIAGQHGLEIAGGENINVIGGTYSNNSSDGGAGIAITGACGDVQIIGVNLGPSYPYRHTFDLVDSQQYALLISGGPIGTVLVANCNMAGYAAPVLVTGSAPRELLICDCAGYNDQNMALNGNAAPTSSLNAANIAAPYSPYFGPSVITFASSTPVTLHIFGQMLAMSFGVIFLPSPYDSFYFSPFAPLSFSWIGK